MDRTTIFLQECGLSPVASRVLSLLLYSEGLTARRISEETQIAKQNLYPVLDTLEAKSLAVSLPTRPKVYRTDAETAFQNILSLQEDRLSLLKKEEKEQIRMIKVAQKDAKKELSSGRAE